MVVPNYKEKIKIVFFDIDETLFLKEKDYLPESTFLAIQKLKKAGVLVGIATGRARFSFPKKLNEIVDVLDIDIFVTINGQYVEYQGCVLENNSISIDQLKRVIGFCDSQKINYAQVVNHNIFVSEASHKLKNALDPITTEYSIDKDYYQQHNVLQLLAFYDETKDDLVKNANILEGLKVVRWHKDSVDILDVNGSKARGIELVVNHLGLTMDNVMAFGDGLNDLEMLSSVGVGVAMGNAREELKQVATHVTDHIEEDGIYNFLVKSKLID
ncbi:hypothetical protein EV697_106105 [Bisgaardia hudsonensis]|uniref:Cof subfamily protein (Haloacid dehalogenase superfamily)/HAD superfamily hydrolase (TIGR01484 family) n=1 Tax=Bisgaardia hudsonensis TaxID=109472 RepID=A0A4R2MS16_9PAST|nr:Cof-type HAD-IIB family hydrolase [Bisgaardia hudsonensis]QLB13766.1 hydrolase [Bisgaardia hudsonensis]TCP11751.1 hypothetical protein EV697_106105 [Bisgaardia hudsonensis]